MEPNRFRWLKLRQIDQTLAPLQQALPPVPRGGWIKSIRSALGMSSAQLAERLGVQQSTVSRLEKSECDGTVTLSSLRKAADALDCDVRYMLVPRDSLEKKVRDRAAQLAASDLARVRRTMALEDQLPGDDVSHEQQEERRDGLLRGSWRNLWKK